MSLFTGILQGQAPPKQDATSTIQTLCLRLTSSTLVEDRRAAILALRSLARDHREIVASEGLRGLIGTLERDKEDLDTVKVVLETLLQLFIGDEVNPNSPDDIAFWLADEFTQKQDEKTDREKIQLLIDLLDDDDFYIRLYALQLLLDILSKRPARTQECFFRGIPSLVSILDDLRDAIRNEAILLLIQLSSGHTEIQKLIGFQSVFERIFAIIELEGGVEGGIIVQDCLKLLSNLLSYNHINQNSFREARGFSALAKLFRLSEDELSSYAKEQRDTNIQFALSVIRLFVVPGGLGTPAHQREFSAAGILDLVLEVAFAKSSSLPLQAEALSTVADLINANGPLQEEFGPKQVRYEPVIPPAEQAEEGKYGVIECLLDLALLESSTQAFDVRLAACRCLEAYFNGNPAVRMQFLLYAKQLWESGDKAANILTCLTTSMTSDSRGDPYRVWFAAVMLIHLISDDTECKIEATAIKEGNASAGEEEVTAIQSISSNLVTALEHQLDPRLCIGYLMLLCIWLYEDSEAVDDFLSEGASVQSLIAVVKQDGMDPLVQGLAAFLLGILYEFSHKESPVPRATLHPLLSSRMGRDHYLSKITKLRSDRRIRDFEVVREDFEPEFKHRNYGLAEVYFDHIFVEFLKDNYTRILKAIDKDPGLETHITANGVTKTTNGVSLEYLDSLKTQLEDKTEELSASESARLTLEQALHQERRESQRTRDAAAAEARKLHEALDAQRRKQDADVQALGEKNRALVDEMTKRNRRLLDERETQLQALKKQLDELARRNREGNEQYQAVARQSAAAAKERDEEMKRVNAQMADVVQRAKRIVQERDETIQVLSRGNEELQARAEELARSARDAEKKAAAAAEAEKVLQKRLVELREEMEAALLALREELRKAREDHTAALAARDTAARGSETRVAALDQELELARSTIEAAEKNTTDLQQRLAEEQAAKAAVEESLAALREGREHELAAAKDLLQQAQDEKDALERRAQAAEAPLSTLKQQLERAETAKQQLESEKSRLESRLKEAEEADEKRRAAEKKAEDAEKRAKDAEAKVRDAEEKLVAAREVTKTALQGKTEAERSASEAGTERDDLLMVLGELEEKKKELKARLKAHGEEVSDDDDEDDEDDDDEEEEEEEEDGDVD